VIVRLLLITFLTCFFWGIAVLGAVTESSGVFVPGFVEVSSGPIRSQGGFGGGLASGRFSSLNSSVSGQSGPLAAVQNAPVIRNERFNFVASLGDTLEISYDDIHSLSGIVELDGELLSFFVEATGGELRSGGNAVSVVALESGQRFVWQLPAAGTLNDLVLRVTALDSVAVTSSESPLGVEDANGILFTVTAQDLSVVDETITSDFGDAEVAVASISETYRIVNDTTLGNDGVALPIEVPSRSGHFTVSSIDFGGSSSGDYQLGGVTLPLVLGPGESETFTVTFSPQDHGDRIASVGFARPGRPLGFFGFGVKGRGNRAPNGFDDEVLRPIGLEPLKIRLADLLLNDRDLDGDMVRFGGFPAMTTARGRSISLINNEWMVYFPGVEDEIQDDSFVYELNDGRGASSTTVVTIRERGPSDSAGAIEATVLVGPGQPVIITVRGIPGQSYQAQFTDQLEPPNTVWNNLGPSTTASSLNGGFQITDPQPPLGQRIYRIIESVSQN
jgi:hypothetical protein